MYDFYVNSKTCQFFLFYNFKFYNYNFFFTIFTKNCMSGSSACTLHTILCKNCQVWFPYFDVFATYPCETSDIFFTSNIIYQAARLIFFSENKWQSVTLSNWSTDWSSSFHAHHLRQQFYTYSLCITGCKPLIYDKDY